MGSVGEDQPAVSNDSGAGHSASQGPPPFEPSLAILKEQASTILAAVVDYGAAGTPDDKSRAITAISHASQKLATVSTSPGVVMQRFAFQPVANAAVRVAIGMGLFNQLPRPGQSATAKQLAVRCGSDAEFVQRIARAVASLGMLEEVAEETYAHTVLSLILSDDTAQAGLARQSSCY